MSHFDEMILHSLIKNLSKYLFVYLKNNNREKIYLYIVKNEISS